MGATEQKLSMVTVMMLLWGSLNIKTAHTTDHSAKDSNLVTPTKDYIAEWQWEQWPQQRVSGNRSRGPGPRAGVSLWYDHTASAWWLFGGRLLGPEPKTYSDLWRYDCSARAWTRKFPANSTKSNLERLMMLNSTQQQGDRTRRAGGGTLLLCGRSDGKDRSFAFYDSRSRHSTTVWQLELGDKLWTAYVCCCDKTDSSPNRDVNTVPPEDRGTLRTETNETRKALNKIEEPRGVVRTHTEKNNVTLDEVTTSSTTSSEVVITEAEKNESFTYSTPPPPPPPPPRQRSRKPSSDKSKDPPYVVERKSAQPPCCEDGRPQETQQFCPLFETGTAWRPQSVAWCDSNRELLIALDLRANPLVLWQFDLRSLHWTQHKVLIENDTLWPGCAPVDGSVRYAASGSAVFLLCLPYGATEPTSTRLVYRLHAATLTLEALGQLQLGAAFEAPDTGAALWADDTRSVLQAVDASPQRTLLLLAYGQLLDIWLLDLASSRRFFVAVENTWRGSALKWFRGFSSPLYHLQIAGQSWLVPNPRPLAEYWVTERGRFIVRLLDHEEPRVMAARNGSEPGVAGLTVLPGPHHAVSQDGLKALLFFAFSLTIFAVFGVAVFVRRCVTCPPRSWCVRGDDGNKATPPVIRYSVIPDDLTYPVA